MDAGAFRRVVSFFSDDDDSDDDDDDGTRRSSRSVRRDRRTDDATRSMLEIDVDAAPGVVKISPDRGHSAGRSSARVLVPSISPSICPFVRSFVFRVRCAADTPGSEFFIHSSFSDPSVLHKTFV